MEAVFCYQLCPIFPQDRVVIHTLDRRALEAPLKPSSNARAALRHALSVLGVRREDEAAHISHDLP